MPRPDRAVFTPNNWRPSWRRGCRIHANAPSAELQYPALYSIAVNCEVARTLRASLPSVDALRQQLDKAPAACRT